jgi:hypothetical protein
MSEQLDPVPIGSGSQLSKTEVVASFFPEWSARTRARYVKAWRLTEFAGRDIRELITLCSRPNGSLCVSKMHEIAETWAAFAVVRTQGASGRE